MSGEESVKIIERPGCTDTGSELDSSLNFWRERYSDFLFKQGSFVYYETEEEIDPGELSLDELPSDAVKDAYSVSIVTAKGKDNRVLE